MKLLAMRSLPMNLWAWWCVQWWHVEGDPLLTAYKEKDIERQFKARLPADSPHGHRPLSQLRPEAGL